METKKTNWSLKGKSFFVWFIIFLIVIFLVLFFWKNREWLESFSGNWSKLINPALKYDELQSIMDSKSLSVKDDLFNYVWSKTINWDINHISVYYRDLSNWDWMGINEKEEFSPASLMKVPLMMAYLKKSESDPNILNETFVFHKNPVEGQFTQNIKPEKQLKDGYEYTVDEAIWYMIKYSDNRASLTLETLMPIEEYKGVFEQIWISFPELKNWSFDNNIRVKDYAAFFRVLFNSSYLNIENSKKALALLNESTFKDWLKAGIPSDVMIAHKFGERWIIWANWTEEKQLHDCWIIYYPNHPYLLCVMTRWYNFDELIDILSEISSIIYWWVDKNYWNNS